LTIPSTLNGQPVGVRVESFLPDPTVLQGNVVNDIHLGFRGQLSGSKLTLVLTEGSIYNHPLGGNQAPDARVVAHAPALAFDTFVTLGSPTLGGPFGNALLVGGPHPCGNSCPLPDTDQTLERRWLPAAGIVIRDQQDFLTARITLTEDARGTWSYLASAAGVIWESPPQPVVNGRMVVVPEPAAAALGIACIACVGAIRHSRMKKCMARRRPRTMNV
jgi:hypothetical protein